MLADIRGQAIQVDSAAVGEWPGTNFTINLNHPAWRTGDERAIRARLLGQVSSDVGVTISSGAASVLTEADIDQIFASTNIIRLSPNDPTATQLSTLADAVSRRAPIEQLFAGTADARELMLAMATVQRDPTTVLAVSQSAAGQDAQKKKRIAENILGIKSMQPIALPSGIPHNANLQQVRDAYNRITDGATGYIRVIGDHLSSWAVTEAANKAQQSQDENELSLWEADERDHEKQEQRRQNEIIQLRETYRQECLAVQERNKVVVERHRSECVAVEQANQRDIDLYRVQIATLAPGGVPPPAPTPRRLPPPPILDPLPSVPLAPPAISPLRARPIKTPPTLFQPLTLSGPLGATLDTPADARAKEIEYASIAASLQGAMDEFTRREIILNDLLRVIQALNLPNLSATFPMLASICTGTPPVLNPTAIRANFDFAGLTAEIERNFPGGLKSVDEYVQDIVAAAAPDPNSRGSAACWAVIRRGLEHQGLAGKELEDTVGYMRSRMQGTPESLRDLETLADAVYSVGPNAAENLREDNELRDAWNKRNSIASAWRLGMAKYDYASEYRDNLFSARNIGMTLRENPLATRRPLAELTHAYFRTKHFLALPEDDPNHLPGTSDVIAFMRRLHAAILRRTQESLHRAEIQQLKALGMNIDADAVASMTLPQRVQAMHDLLRGGSSSYESTFKSQLDAMAKRASRNRVEVIEGRETLQGNLLGAPKSAVGYLNPLAWLRGIGSAAASETGAKGIKAAWSATKNNAVPMAVGALIGSVLIPVPGVGAAAGAAIAPFVKKYFVSDKQ